ncbi:MAG TPA: DUF2905 family protein [Thermoanaerobaculia bacterium]
MNELGRLLLILGAVLLAAGLIFLAAGRLGLGRLPGDFVLRRGNVSCYFPLATSILLSLLLTLAFWILGRR